MKKSLLTILLASSAIIPFQGKSQMLITDSLDFASISTLLQGFGTNITNTVYNCDSASVAQYGGVSELPNMNGLLLSTGFADSIAHPSTYFCSGVMANGVMNDFDMSALAGNLPTYDGCILEFDCVPLGDTLLFNYTFASEEYPEFVNSGFNDAFGIFLTGPGYANVNIATIPGTSTPVTVNNINAGTNSSFYYDNSAGLFCGFDAFTLSLTSTTAVTPNQSYHFKIGVADASDQIFDTGVFLEAFSFRSNLTTGISNNSLNSIRMINDEMNNRVVFRFTNPSGENTTLQIFDLNGKQIAAEKINAGQLSYSYALNQLSGGMYMARISSGENKVNTFRFIAK